MIDGLVEFSGINKRAIRHVASFLSNLQLQLPSISVHLGNLLSILFAFVLLNVSVAFAKPPEFTNCPSSSITNSHCKVFSYRFQAVDPDGDSVRYELASGPGYIDSIFGIWTWRDAKEEHVGQKLAITVRAVTARGKSKCTAGFQVTNQAPTLTEGCGSVDTVIFGRRYQRKFDHTDDCGTATYKIVPFSNGTRGSYEIDAQTGEVAILLDSADLLLSQPLMFQVIVTDEAGAADSCEYQIIARRKPFYTIRIDSVAVSQRDEAQIFEVPILISAIDSAEEIGGFDLVISYDSKDVVLESVTRGALIDSCSWKYFTHRLYPSVTCTNCTERLIRVVALKHVGYPLPFQCVKPLQSPISIAKLTFRREPWNCSDEDILSPIRFLWVDCSENILSSEDGGTLFSSQDVFESSEFSSSDDDVMITKRTAGLPTIFGAPQQCFDIDLPPGKKPHLEIDFFDGFMPVSRKVCIDYRGDLNFNGTPFETIDLERLVEFIRHGWDIQSIPAGLSIQHLYRAGDINEDNHPFTIADLIEMMSTVNGAQSNFLKLNQPQPEGGK